MYGLITKTSHDYTVVSYDKFALYNFCTKLFVTTAGVLLTYISALVLMKITKNKLIGFGFLLLLFTEPFYIGLLRNLHMDVLVASFIFSAVMTFYAGLITGKTRYFLISGFLCGLGLLTKSIAISALGLNFVAGIYFLYIKKDFKYIKYFILSVAVAAATFFALFPAMWVAPVQTLNKIYTEGIIKTGLMGEDSFDHVVNGIQTSDPGYGYYLKIIKYRFGPLAQISLVSSVVLVCLILFKKIKSGQAVLIVLSALYILGYLITFSLLQKKTDRYIASVIPFISLISILIIYTVYGFIRSKQLRIVFVLFVSIGIVINLLTLIKIHPYYLAYYDPIWGGINKAKKQIYINQGGIGGYEIASFLNTRILTADNKIGATNREFKYFSKYPIQGLDYNKRKTYKYAVLTLQKDGGFKSGMDLVYTLKVLGEPYLKVYERKQ